MRLKEYATRFPGRTQEQWGRLFGISRTYFKQLCDGTRTPSHEIICRIAEKTGGAVTPDSWFPGYPSGGGAPAPEPHEEYVEP